ncbi:MAG: arsenate reductase ArsC, partial [Acidobacteria bacterium]|nr:arsenate reductase ArsC [Acidobacteriota bacterium]
MDADGRPKTNGDAYLCSPSAGRSREGNESDFSDSVGWPVSQATPIGVLFLCTANSCRSQMAEGLLHHLSGGRMEAASAGTHPRSVNPDAIRCMAEIGIDISSQRSKSLDLFLGEHVDYVITVCDQARDA